MSRTMPVDSIRTISNTTSTVPEAPVPLGTMSMDTIPGNNGVVKFSSGVGEAIVDGTKPGNNLSKFAISPGDYIANFTGSPKEIIRVVQVNEETQTVRLEEPFSTAMLATSAAVVKAPNYNGVYSVKQVSGSITIIPPGAGVDSLTIAGSGERWHKPVLDYEVHPVIVDAAGSGKTAQFITALI